MKVIYMIILWVGATVFPAVAHNAKIATFTLRDTGAGWLVEMNFAQAGVDAAMLEQHGETKIKGIDKKDYQDSYIGGH